ncbi:hypothetical protein ColLi_13767 [Colletotrichum liriopes]|uniref:Uncharacterized protein n=1 Tax=Colletotrichum liriopes TaxID=708192 RepID=A0AA37H0V8_9PEZI|nr:hypothetical protein ColLi_13767 [Colletotrichum liriopes]
MSFLKVINYRALMAREAGEVQKLAQISFDQGLFFLDLEGSHIEAVLAKKSAIIQAQRSFLLKSQRRNFLLSPH